MSHPPYQSLLIIDLDRRYKGTDHTKYFERVRITDCWDLMKITVAEIRQYQYVVISAFDWPNDVDRLPQLIMMFEHLKLPEPLVIKRRDQNATTEEVLEAIRNPERHRYVPTKVVREEPEPSRGWFARILSRLRGRESSRDLSC